MLRRIFWKRKIKMLGVCLLLLVVMAAMLVYAYIDADEVIRFSKKSGFYDESFYLEIQERKGCTFYYTLDGSEPDLTSQKYVSPILIEDVSGKNNIYSARKDVSPGLYDEQRGTVEISPDHPVDKCNVVRVATYDGRQRLIAEATEVYFIGFQGKSGYDGIMKVSLVTDPDNLFDFESGIYVLGKKYDEYPQKGDTTILMTTANYFEKGKDWEKAALLDLFDQNGEKVFSSDCGIRIHGGMTRNNPQKSFSIYARDVYGVGGERFTYDLFENGVGVHKFILSSGGNDAVKVKDYITQKTAADAELNVATMKMIPCTLFLNGEYWGTYYMTESYNASYISDHYGVAEGNVVMVKTRGDGVVEMKEGNEEDIELYHEMTEYISNHDMREKDAYQKACEMLDIDSFVDYYAMEIYIGNHDWPGNNEALWRAREEYPLNIWADGRWRYMLFDTNLYSVFGDASLDDLERAIDSDPVFASLMQNAEVEQKFKERIRQLGNEVFCFENREAVFNRWFDEMSEPVKKSNERFYDITYLEDISSSLASMKLFLEERPEYMEQYMWNCFGDEK